jgi:hypothetical protein
LPITVARMGVVLMTAATITLASSAVEHSLPAQHPTKVVQETSLPTYVNFRAWAPPTKNQAGPTCVLNSAAGAAGYFLKRYSHVNINLTWPVSNTMSAVERANGLTTVPLVIDDLRYLNTVGWKPSPFSRTVTLGYHQIWDWPAPSNVEGLKADLAHNVPVILAFELYNDYLTHSGWGYYSAGPNSVDANLAHEVVIFGYDSQGVLYQNSWGSSYGGTGGWGHFSWAFVAQAQSAYSITSVHLR